MSNSLQGASERFAGALAGVREWLRRAMPRVALAAGALYVLRLLIRQTWLYRNTPVSIIGVLTFFAVASVIVYYGLKILVRLKRSLLWRVRRRLMITYLFVGLTPIVLLLLLGALAAVGGSSQAMVRVVTVQLGATERQTLEGARALADALLSLPPNANERGAQGWLDERAALLQAALPGARVSVWRGAEGEQAGRLGADAPAWLASAKTDDATRGVGFDTGEAREPLPAWLEGRQEWSGFAYLQPQEDSGSAFCTPSVRALVRRAAQGRAVAVLVNVPVSRALIERYRENTGVNVRPFFFFLRPSGVEERAEGANVEPRPGDTERAARRRAGEPDSVAAAEKRPQPSVDLTRDQFGEEMPNGSDMSFPNPVVLSATDWTTGEQSKQVSFMADWSWSEGGKQFWSNPLIGDRWWLALYYIAVVFLVLEITALLSAAWMTRAVTGTVHKLYRATEFIKRGDFSHRIRTRSRDQLGELALAFNDMSSDIETLLAKRVELERLEREIEIAHEVQAQLFPRSTPALATAEITGECRAARGVAGDYYDFIEVAPGLVAFAIGDVSGKGISASLVMSNLQAALRAQAGVVAERLKMVGQQLTAATTSAGGGAVAPHAGVGDGGAELSRGVAATLERGSTVAGMTASINEQLCRSTDSNRFATLFLALYDDRTRTLRYTNAGHNAPILVRAVGAVERLSTGGIIVGAFDSVKFEEGRTTLGAGDLLILFSDGLSEAQNGDGEEYGEERLTGFAAAHRTETVNNLRQSIFDEVDKWSGAVERGDDQTLVLLKAVTSDE
jgi:sigma-B regulation protein RsbU (phosphoserine phosphatase)